MPIETTPWDAADYLKTAEAQEAYLEEAFSDGDPAFIAHAIGVVARAKGISAVAAETGLTRPSLYKALDKTGNPTLTTLTAVMKALGYRLAIAKA